jgi:hypothetical protein
MIEYEGARAGHKPGSVSRISYPLRDNGHSSIPTIANEIKQPTRGLGRVALKRPSIWSCSGWGLPSLRCHHRSGELLPHLFTLTPHPVLIPLGKY